MKMKYCCYLTILLFIPVINADGIPLSRNFVDIHQLSEDVGDDSQRIFNVLGFNTSILMDKLNKLNIGRLLNGLSFNSVLKEIVNTTNAIHIPNVSLKCMAVGMQLLAPLKNATDFKQRTQLLLTSPVGKMLDAWGKIPSRVLLGNLAWLGAYDECSSLEDMHYCYSSIIVMSKTQLSIQYGSCFPKACSDADVGELLSALNAYTKGIITFTKWAMCKEPIKYGTGAVITMAIMVAILVLCAFGTYTDIVVNRSAVDETDISKEMSNIIVNKGVEPDQGNSIQPSSTNESNSMVNMAHALKDNGWTKFILCFSLLKNTESILSTKSIEGSITSINGIRVLSLSWVILGHCYVIVMFSKPDNILNMSTIVERFSFEAIVNATVSVDSFFLLSGLLVGYLTLKRINKKGGMGIADILKYYLHRYIRLTPSLGLVILFYTNIFPLILSGPSGMLMSQTTTIQQPCLDYWWSSILYFNNFYPEGFAKECYALAWYLANDMQFYIIAPGILLLMVYIEKKFDRGQLYNFFLIMLLCLLSVVITGIIIGVDNLPIVMRFEGDPLKLIAAQAGQDRVYVKPYCRITPYLVGLFLGYLFSRNATLNRGNGRLIASVGWVTAIITGLAIIYGPWHVFKENGTPFSDAENVIYGMLSRFAWGCALAWVIYACHNKVGGIIDQFLSWSFWLPLSRLSYGAYLLHLMVLMFYVIAKQEATLHYQEVTLIFSYISVTFISFVSSFILTVCVDYPVANLEKIIFKR